MNQTPCQSSNGINQIEGGATRKTDLIFGKQDLEKLNLLVTQLLASATLIDQALSHRYAPLTRLLQEKAGINLSQLRDACDAFLEIQNTVEEATREFNDKIGL